MQSAPQTGRYADMWEIARDLRWVSSMCRRSKASDAAATAARYAQCFRQPRKAFSIRSSWLENLPADLTVCHAYLVAGRAVDAETLSKLADYFVRLLLEDMHREAIELRELARRMSFC
jgi:hypothetical protein